MSSRLFRALVRAAVAAGLLVAASIAHAAPPAYVSAGSYQLPSANSAFDAGADGRLVCITEAGAIVRQNAVNGGVYTPLGSVPADSVPNFGAAFIRVSPAGGPERFAVGDNGAANRVYVVGAAALSTAGPTTPQTIAAPNFDGAWAGTNTMYVSGAPDFSTPPSLFRLDLTTGTTTQVVSNVGNGSGGVAVRGGRVYTAIGFDAGGVLDGQVRSFDLATLNAATTPVPFFSGLLATQASTGNTADFDALGNIIVAGFGGVTLVDLATAQRYDLPGLSGTGFYAALFNDATQEILVRDFGSATVLRYAVPGPGVAATLAWGGLLSQRRRRA